MKKRDILLMEEIKAFVDANLDSTITIKSLCRDYNINRNKLQTGFQEISCMSIRSYIIHRKMELAAIRLQETEDSIKELSLEYGYKSARNFGKAFKIVFNESPSHYRNKKNLSK